MTINNNPGRPERTTDAERNGVGLTWADPNNFLLSAYYAHKLGHEVATSAPDKNGRVWLQAVKFF